MISELLSELYEIENHVSTSDKKISLQILSVWSEQTHVNRQWQLNNNLFRHLGHDLNKKKEMMLWVKLILRSYDLVAY